MELSIKIVIYLFSLIANYPLMIKLTELFRKHGYLLLFVGGLFIILLGCIMQLTGNDEVRVYNNRTHRVDSYNHVFYYFIGGIFMVLGFINIKRKNRNTHR